ncbi:MAG: insulinase family protein [Hyphomonadaceae bacterium]|nr:insulinase family protein [Hyphomonadaceae bacterium]
MRGLLNGLAALVALLVLAVPAWAQAEPQTAPWAHETSDIAPDPAVRFGALPNGMRYALLKNQLPPGAVSIRMSVEFGSLDEAENEKGLAHFIEHMAFNGSKNVVEGEMVRILERLGLAFGADTNASTGQEFTTYQLELPNASDALLDESLFLLRELASELTFNAGAIDRERGVVLSEWRRGDNFQRRRSDQELDFLIPGAYAATRMPIGDPAVLETATRETMISLYERYYRPERTVLILVGDFDVDAVERKITETFSGWVGKGEAGQRPDLAYMPKTRPSEASVFIHKDGGDSISVYSLMPYTDLPDTAANRREDNLLMFGISAIGRRLAPMANEDDRPFRSAGLTTGDILKAVDVGGASVVVTPENWRAGLQRLEQEWRRALLFGFTKDEIARQIDAMRTSQKNQVERQNTRTTGALIGSLLSSVQNKTVFATPSSGLARLETWADKVTPEMVNEAFQARMPMKDPLFFAAATLERKPADILAAWEESGLIEVSPPEVKARGAFAYTNFGRAGKVVKDTRLADIDTRLIAFANNVRLNIKKTTFAKNTVQVSVRVGHGNLDFPETPFGLNALMSAFSNGGLEKHSIDDLRALLQGRQVGTRFNATSTSFGGTYATTPKDLELQLQLVAAYVMHPGYRSEAERRWRETQVLSWPRLDQNAQTVWSVKGMRALASGDRRYGLDPDDGDAWRSFVELRHYLTPVLQTGAIEIAVVGDIDEAAVIALVAKTFGALPMRAEAQSKFRSDKPVVFRQDKTPLVFTHGGEASQALAQVYWPVTDVDPDADPQMSRVLGVAAAIMRLKVVEEVRETLGATYSPTAGASLSSVNPGFGYVNAGAEVKPEDVDRVIGALEKIAAQMRAGEISDDEFSRAITPSLEALPQNATSNGYWLNLISQAQGRPDILARNTIPAVEASLRAVTKADVVAAANRWLTVEAQQEARVVPAAKAGTQ